ncbi:MAG: methyltransferase domain-containing protein [Thermodesulfobacteriota bacterium]|jgi:SAM-dependent methyltransferase|nr:MAG: methyltransferase domain-containing protein [Thermodesulfobacteriota bacterium]
MDGFRVKPAELLVSYVSLFTAGKINGPILDLACGDGHNGIFLAQIGLEVICCDLSEEALKSAQELAAVQGVSIKTWCVDLEKDGTNPLSEDFYGGMVVFRYLHRPLINCIKKALKKGGVLIYETYTVRQPQFGKPHNPDFLLKPEELQNWFIDWEIIYFFEGIKENPKRAIAQIVCRK